MSKAPKFTISSGNVYADLGFDDPELEMAKAKLASRIIDVISERGLTQTAAAKILGMAQPNLSKLMTGQLERFSVEKLMRLLTKLDQDVAIVVTPAEHGGRFTATVPIATAAD